VHAGEWMVGDVYAPAFPHPSAATSAAARPLATVAIDAEEDFDWRRPIAGTINSTACMHDLGQLQSILSAYGAYPTYLLTYPVLADPIAVRALRRYFERGECALGLQLHTWVTPPLEGAGNVAASFSGNVSAELEEAKLLCLRDAFIAAFGVAPVVFRSGRYGVSGVTAALLEKHGFEVDTSVAPRTSFAKEGGPDFEGFEYTPFWFGEHRRLLEVPLCRSIVGWGGRAGRAAYQMLASPSLAKLPLQALLARSRAAERITLSPEGNSLADMRRLARWLRGRGCQVLSLSFHSSSLAIGHNPYVRSKADLHQFYDRLSGTLEFLADTIGCGFVTLPEIPALMHPSPREPRR
jgi:hypothetical protein